MAKVIYNKKQNKKKREMNSLHALMVTKTKQFLNSSLRQFGFNGNQFVYNAKWK